MCFMNEASFEQFACEQNYYYDERSETCWENEEFFDKAGDDGCDDGDKRRDALGNIDICWPSAEEESAYSGCA